VLVKPNQADLLVLKELCETGKVKPVIDRQFPLSEVASAVRYVEDGHARGKVVVTVAATGFPALNGSPAYTLHDFAR